MRLHRALLLAAVVGLAATTARADVKPHPIFSDNMVLQQGTDVVFFGKADPGEEFMVGVGKQGGPGAKVKADKDGNWLVTLPKQEPGTGYVLFVDGKNKIEFKNVAVGEVWICSGQSNMQWELWRLTKDDQGKKVAAAAANPNVRLYTVPRRPSAEPQSDYPVQTVPRDKDHTVTFGKWQECTPETALEFSAVAYFFGRDLQKARNVPVGLIATNWGGTVCEAWASKGALEADPGLKYLAGQFDATVKAYDSVKAKAKYEDDLEKWKKDAEAAKAAGKNPPARPQMPLPGGINQNSPTALYNGMIFPIQRFPIKGAIWYQGESNAGRAAEYRTLFPAMIQDWRKQWGSEFPFLAVQLAPYKAEGSDKVSYAELRDAQYFATKKLPKVGLAVITDVGEENDIHPQQKEPVGGRLALAARGIAYGEKVEYSGPVYKSMRVDGDKVALTFDHADGLVAKGSELNGFTVCGEDKTFHPAKAEIKGDAVVVSSEKVIKPVAVRYGWVNFAKPELNLFNKAGLPAVPFRTDDFPLTTAGQTRKG
jgi:sialate O-acetylesterase